KMAHVPVSVVVAKVKARATAATIEMPTNGAAVEATVSATSMMSDTPTIRVSLRRRAASLGCEIGLLENTPEAGLDYGPYVLVHAPSGHFVWEGGLPVEGIADALDCLVHERQLPDGRFGDAWVDFGKTWMR